MAEKVTCHRAPNAPRGQPGDMDAHNYNCQFLQDPASPGGNLVQPEWFALSRKGWIAAEYDSVTGRKMGVTRREHSRRSLRAPVIQIKDDAGEQDMEDGSSQ